MKALGMKVQISVDLTPIEARTLMGLPDVTPLHDLYLDRMKSLVEDGVTPELVGSMMKSWSTMGDAGMSMMQHLFSQIGSGMMGGNGGNGRNGGTKS